MTEKPNPGLPPDFWTLAKDHAAEVERIAAHVYPLLVRWRDTHGQHAQHDVAAPSDARLQRLATTFAGAVLMARDETSGEPVRRIAQSVRELARTLSGKRAINLRPDDDSDVLALLRYELRRLQHQRELKGLPPIGPRTALRMIADGSHSMGRRPGAPEQPSRSGIADLFVALYWEATHRLVAFTREAYPADAFPAFADDLNKILPSAGLKPLGWKSLSAAARRWRPLDGQLHLR